MYIILPTVNKIFSKYDELLQSLLNIKYTTWIRLIVDSEPKGAISKYQIVQGSHFKLENVLAFL